MNNLTGHYVEIIEMEFATLLAEMSEQTADYYLSMLSALDGGISIGELKDIHKKLQA